MNREELNARREEILEYLTEAEATASLLRYDGHQPDEEEHKLHLEIGRTRRKYQQYFYKVINEGG